MRALLLQLLPLCARATNAAGATFLENNKQKAGVVTLSSGLQYRIVETGDGLEHPRADTECACHYEGRTAQESSKTPPGKKFDSSFDRGEPASFAPNQVIGGWTVCQMAPCGMPALAFSLRLVLVCALLSGSHAVDGSRR